MGEGRQRWGSPLGFHCLTRCSPGARDILPVWGGERQVTGMGRDWGAKGPPGIRSCTIHFSLSIPIHCSGLGPGRPGT